MAPLPLNIPTPTPALRGESLGYSKDDSEKKATIKKKVTIRSDRDSTEPLVLRTPAEIMWSLGVRNLTKKLVFLFQMEDQEHLVNWLLTESIENIRNAIKDLGGWPGWTPEKVHLYKLHIHKLHSPLPTPQAARHTQTHTHKHTHTHTHFIHHLPGKKRGPRLNRTGRSNLEATLEPGCRGYIWSAEAE